MRESVLACLLVASLSAVGCDNKRGVVAELESLADRLCACSSNSCADAAMADLEKLKSANPTFEPAAAEEVRARAALERFNKCSRAFSGLTMESTELDERRGLCGDTPCLAVPNGIKGLAFGMSVKDVAEALGIDESSVVATTPRRIAPESLRDPIEALLNPTYALADASAVPLPGTSAVLESTVGKRPARCTLDFTASEQLAGIYCVIEGTGDGGFDERFATGLRDQLTAKYGPPTAVLDEMQSWRSETAVLECSRRFGVTYLNSFTTTHERLVAETLERATLAMKRSVDAAKREAERAAAAKEAALREALRALERDTSPAAERANPAP